MASRALVSSLVLLAATAAVAAQDAVTTDQDEEILGGTAAFSDIDEERPRVWIPAESPLFEAPDSASHRIGTIDALSEVETIEQQGDWYRIHHQGRVGWVQPDLPRHERTLDVSAEIRPLAVETPGFAFADADRRLELALAALGLGAPNGSLGPWALLTDLDNATLFTRLDRVASQLAGAYRDRYGMQPTPASEQYIAVFSTEETYRPFEAEATHLAGFGARGHSGGNLAALFVGDDHIDEASTLLVHELAHLMNRSGLGPSPPPWLEEGIANDLAYCKIDRSGNLRPGSINGERVTMGTRRSGISIQYSGAIAAFAELLRTRAKHQGTPFEQLVALDQPSFLDSERRQLHYIESAFLVRFLLEGDKQRYGDGFRAYLEAVGQSHEAVEIDLIDYLDTDWKQIELGFDSWLRVQSAELMR